MRNSILGGMILAAGLFVGGSAQADTVAYPDQAHASFLVDYPSNWKMTPGDNVGDYITLTGPTGVNLQFRTVPGGPDAIEDAVKETFEYIEKTYKNTTFGQTSETKQAGMDAFVANGDGVEADGGTKVHFAMAWVALKDGNIGEVWYVVEASDKAGNDAAVKVMNSFRGK